MGYPNKKRNGASADAPFADRKDVFAVIDLKNPRTVVKWLRNCNEDPKEPDRCHRCPYGIYADGGGEYTCMDELHRAAASVIERLAKQTGEG